MFGKEKEQRKDGLDLRFKPTLSAQPAEHYTASLSAVLQIPV